MPLGLVLVLVNITFLTLSLMCLARYISLSTVGLLLMVWLKGTLA